MNEVLKPTGEDIMDPISTTQSSETDTFFIPTPRPPPRAHEIDQWQHHLAFQNFGEVLQCAAAFLFQTRPSPSTNMFMCLWLSKKTKIRSSPYYGIRRTQTPWKSVQGCPLLSNGSFEIPYLDCHVVVNQKILHFKSIGGNCKDGLKNVYYAGHAKLTTDCYLGQGGWFHATDWLLYHAYSLLTPWSEEPATLLSTLYLPWLSQGLSNSMVRGFQTALVPSSSAGRPVVPSLVSKYVSESLKSFFVLGKAADYLLEAVVARSIRF